MNIGELTYYVSSLTHSSNYRAFRPYNLQDQQAYSTWWSCRFRTELLHLPYGKTLELCWDSEIQRKHVPSMATGRYWLLHEVKRWVHSPNELQQKLKALPRASLDGHGNVIRSVIKSLSSVSQSEVVRVGWRWCSKISTICRTTETS